MKPKNHSGARLLGTVALCLSLAASGADAKPDKDKGKGKGGGGGHSEKGNKGKHDNKGQHKGNADNKGKGNADKDLQKDFDKDRKDFGKEAEKRDKEIAKWREKRFRDEDRNSVVEYFGRYRDNEHGLPPGLAKNLRRGKPLPPGWQKKLHNGYIIEDGYYDHFDPISYELFPGLEAVPDTRLYRFGDRIVRVYEPRREIIDVITVPTIRY